ncbi:GNAT family N-acetyltransferase [Variovorax soli]|uniref:GNAT superfamily N-acetyltransferase n=1 Tax=Variovorax soli TaxID=376815 RepID=A0ABU1NF98_9BURK|nr:GNAT family N-acetyltransferase [Variovorax soli]MDR6537147.1 GNAT superfamily N-acetyltransferase [Variovorax soli]
MKRADIAILPAEQWPRGALAALWNLAYAGYVVPVAFDAERFARHLRRANVELALSKVLTAGGEPAGLSLVGRRDRRAYLAGFGIVRAQRRRGLARLLIEVQLAALPPAGVDELVLEVLEPNPARTLYRRAGFEAVRPLELLEGTLDTRAVETVALGLAELAAAHQRCSAVTQPTWRRELPTVLDALTHENAAALGVRRGDTVVAYAVLPEPARHDGTLLDAAALDETAAHSLLDMLASARPGTRWRLVDEPRDSPFFRGACARGLAPVLRQIEMKRSF